MHAAIRSDDIQTFMPECWAGFVPLKAEYYKALAHYHASKSLPANGEMQERRDDDQNVDRGSGGVASVLSAGSALATDGSGGGDVLDVARTKLAHIKESLGCHDETQRLQRMCRELRNKLSLTKLLNESYLRAVCETEMLEQSVDVLRVSAFDDDLSGVELTIAAASKFSLTLIGPDFTAYKADDPFRGLGPIAIFSARRHWSAPRNIRLQTGSATAAPEVQPQQQHRYYVHMAEAVTPVAVTDAAAAAAPQRRVAHDSAEYGFHMRGDAPVIVSGVMAGSLADVSG